MTIVFKKVKYFSESIFENSVIQLSSQSKAINPNIAY